MVCILNGVLIEGFLAVMQLSSPSTVILVELELWDTGERALNKFDHILPTCRASTDGALLFFSYEDR